MLKFNSEQTVNTSIPYDVALGCLKVKALKEGLARMNCRVSRDFRKAEIVRVIADHVLYETDEVWEVLSEESREVIRALLAAGKGVGIDVPNMMELQKSRELREMNLVVDCDVVVGTCKEGRGTVTQMAFKLFLLDDVYDAFSKSVNNDFSVNNESAMELLRQLGAELYGDKEGADFFKSLDNLQKMSDELYGNKDNISPLDSKYSCSEDLIKDVRALKYKEKTKVLKAFQKELKKNEYWYHSFFGVRFNETFSNIHFHKGEIDTDDDSLMWLSYAENDFANVVTAIDYDDPMTFFDIAMSMEKEMKTFGTKTKA